MVARGWPILACLVASLAPLAAADHATTGFYVIHVSKEWSDPVMDVLVVPPHHGQLRNHNGLLGGQDPDELHPCDRPYLAATRDAIQSWTDAIHEFSTATTHAFSLRPHVLGCDPAAEAPAEPEVMIAYGESFVRYHGAAYYLDPCLITLGTVNWNPVASYNPEDMFNLAAHELGHCLGVGHAGEHPDGSGDDHPSADLMEAHYDYGPARAGTPRLCVSTLVMAGVERAHDGVLQVGEEVRVAVEEYRLSTSPQCSAA